MLYCGDASSVLNATRKGFLSLVYLFFGQMKVNSRLHRRKEFTFRRSQFIDEGFKKTEKFEDSNVTVVFIYCRRRFHVVNYTCINHSHPVF